uniref:AAT6 n=1 Tax=Sinonovacula rivularis TaxID=489091 RepID=A0AA50A9H3_9BIVA|nr:AAT6 [Sinonovacula rivularis]
MAGETVYIELKVGNSNESETLRHLNNLEESSAAADDAEVRKDVSRDRWGSRFEFLLAIIGYTVGIGSIYRFPVKCATNGGGAFLIPFFFFMFLCGGPLYYIEVCIGQYYGKSAGVAFEMCPLFKGLGLLMVMISFNILWYYLTITAWILYYFVNSFYKPLPWSTCGNWWNTNFCKELLIVGDLIPMKNRTDPWYNLTDITRTVSPALEFWRHKVLRVSDGLESMGSIQWHLVIGSFVGWALVVVSLIKGVKSLGKVVYVTAIAPYILLTVLLIQGLTLDGAIDGLVWYITPDWSKLAQTQVWLDAAIQVFFSLGPTYGGVISLASHNHFRQKSIVEVTVCVLLDTFTAFYAGLVVFSCLGFMAKETGVSVDELAKSSDEYLPAFQCTAQSMNREGPGLAFVAYPEALSRMPLPQLWAVLFFLTLITVAFDSTFGMYETVIGTLFDMFPSASKLIKYVILVGVAGLLFLVSLPLSMNGGIYLFQLADWYMAAFALLFGSALEGIVVCWIYGSDRLAHDIEMMTGRKSSVFLRFLWCILMTGTLLVCFIASLFIYEEPNYGDGYVFKPYAIFIGVMLSLLPFVPVVVCMIKGIVQTNGTILQRLSTLLKPSPKWQPFDAKAREMCRTQPYRYENRVIQRIKRNIMGNKDTPWI